MTDILQIHERIFAQVLGIEDDEEFATELSIFAKELLYIQPDGWRVIVGEGELQGIPLFLDGDTEETSWSHPYEETMREKVEDMRSTLESQKNQLAAVDEEATESVAASPRQELASSKGSEMGDTAGSQSTMVQLEDFEVVFAQSLGIDPEERHALVLMYFAKELLYIVPDGWEVLINKDSSVKLPYFFDPANDESHWIHPYEEHYRDLIEGNRAQLLANDPPTPSSAGRSSRSSFSPRSSNASPRSSISSGSPRNPFSATEEQKDSNSPLPPIGGGAGGAGGGGGAAAAAEQAGLDAKLHEVERQFARSLSVRSNEEFESELYDYANELLQTLPEGWEFAIAESDDALFPLFVRLEDEKTQLEHPLQADHKQTLQELRYVLTYGVFPESAEQAAALTSPVAPSTAEPGADNKTSEEEKVSAKSRTDTATRATATAKLPSLRPTSASARSIANASVNDMSSKPLPLMRAHSARLIRSGKLDPVSGKERPMSAKAVEMVDEWIGAAVNTVRQSARPATADSQPRSHAVEDDTAVEPIFDLKSRSFSIKLLRQNEPDADKPVLHYLESENLGGYEDLSPSEAVDGPPLSSKAAAALGKPAIPLSTVGEEASVGSGSLHSASVKAAAGGGGGTEEGGGEKGEGGGSLEGEDQRSLQARRSSLSSRERLDELRSDKHKNTIAHTMSILEPSLSDDDLTLNSGRRQRSSKALGGGDGDGDEGDDTETVHTANTISTHPHADTEAVAGPGEGDGGESFGMDKATLEALGIDAAKVEQELADLALTPKGPSPTAATAEAAATAAASAEAEAEAAENAESTVGAKGSDSDGPVEHISDELSVTIQKPSEDALAASSPKQATPPEEKKTPANEFVFNKIELKPQLMILQFGSIGNDDDDGVDYDAMDDGDDDDTHGNVSLEKFSAMVTDPVPSPPPEPETASPEESASGRSGSSSSSPHKKMEGGQGQDQEQEKDEEEEEDDVKLSPPEASPVPPPTIEAYPQPGADSAPRDDDGDGDNNGTAADLEPRELDPESAEWAQRQLQEYMQRKPHTAASTTSSGGDDNASSGQRSPRRYASAGISGAHSSSRGGGAPTSAQRRTTTTVGTRGRTGVLRGNRDAPDSPSFVLNIAQGNSIHVNTKFLDALRAKRKEQPAASARRSPVKVVKVSKKPPNTIGGDDPEQQSGPAGGSDEALLANWSHDSAEGNKTAELGPLKRTSSKRSPLKCVRFGPSGNDVLNANKWYLVGCYRHYKQAVHARNLVEGMVMTDSQGTILIDPRLVFLDEEAGANDEGGDGGSPDAQNNVNANDMTFSMSMAKNSGFYSPSQTQSIIQDPNSISGKWSSCREPQPADASSTVYGATIGSSNTMGATSRATRMPKENDTAELIMGRVKRTTESLVKLRVRKDMCRMQWVVETDEKEVWKIAHRHKKKKGVDLEGGPGNLAVAQLKMSHKAKSLGKASEGGTDEDELVGEKLPPIHNPAAVKAAFAATKAFGAIAKMKISDGEAGRKRIPMITKKERKSSALNRSSKDRSSNNRVEALDSTVGRRSESAGGPHNNGPLMLPDIQQRRGLSSV